MSNTFGCVSETLHSFFLLFCFKMGFSSLLMFALLHQYVICYFRMRNVSFLIYKYALSNWISYFFMKCVTDDFRDF